MPPKTAMPSHPIPGERQVRVFISSTFHDMQAERDELVKRVFPQLRRLCAQRGVTWGEVDLRWGVTDEQSAEGRVLPLCLKEIQRCRPYFIGLLGERYGWIPEEIPQELIEREPWLAEHRDHSVTELEILHGVLNDPAMAEHSYFYFRDPAYLKRLRLRLRKEYREQPGRKEVAALGRTAAKLRAEQRRRKLADLKERIRRSSLPLRENYPNPRALGEWVLQDFTDLIDRLFPEGGQPGPLERESAGHEAFALSRTGVYIERPAYFDQLNSHARGKSLPLVVLGESGSGKSALLANWAFQYRQAHPDELVLVHFIGATPLSMDWAAMLRRIMGELQRRFDLPGETPDQPEALRSAFANWLSMASARGRVVLVLDALDQLEDRQGASDLVWLPPVLPPNVRLVLSTLPGRPLEELKKRGWPALQVEPLGVDERKQLIESYLSQYSKALSAARLERIAAASQCANPLYLRVLLDELRQFGMHERLDERINFYLQTSTPADLYEKVLERCEQDYEIDHPGLVRDAMSLLWAARRGLSEAELLDLLGMGGAVYWPENAWWGAPLYIPLPAATWSPLSLALEGSLLDRGGLIGFAHDFLRQAVQDRYLPEEKAQRARHGDLADYFDYRENHPRRIDELPWQLAQAGEWSRLVDLLGNPEFFGAAWESDEYEVNAYWAQVEANSDLRMVNAYKKILDQPTQYGHSAWAVSTLLYQAGHLAESLSLRKTVVEACRRRGDLQALQAALGGQALVIKATGDLEGAMALHREEETICRALGNKDGLQRSLGNQGTILYYRGDLDGAMALYREKEQLCREMGNTDGLASVLGNQALILKNRGRLAEALALHKEEQQLCRAQGNKNGLQQSLGNQALILHALGDLDGATALHQEEEHICRELGNKGGLARSLGNQALILYGRGDMQAALALEKEQERIYREIGDKLGLEASQGNQANILAYLGNLEAAMILYKEQENLCRALGNKAGLSDSLGNQALVFRDRGNLGEAMKLLKEQERLCRELESKDGLQRCLGNQGVIHYFQGDMQQAMFLHKERERLCRELGNKTGLASALGDQALILKSRRDLDGAMALHKEEERLCREQENRNGLQLCLGNQALVHKARGDLEAAMKLLKEQEQLCRALGDRQGYSRSLINQASILGLKLNKPREALLLAEEAYRLASQSGYAALIKDIEHIRNTIRAQIG